MIPRIILSLLFIPIFISARINVYSIVDDNQITINESITLKIVAEGSNDYPQVNISQIKDFTVISGPAQSSSFQWINGKMSSSKTLSWTLIPNKQGSLSIPALKVKVDNKKYTLKPIQISVTQIKQRRPSGTRNKGQTKKDAPLLFLDVQPDKEDAFQGEQISVYYKLYTRVRLRQYSIEKKPKGVGFWQEQLSAPRQPTFRETSVNGVRYQVATLYKIALFPTTSGELVVDPMVLNCTYEVPSRSRVSPLFDDFFSDSFFSRTSQMIVRSDPLKFKIKQIPLEGRPKDFTGAVGTYTLSSYLDTTVTEAHQAISYTIELEGTGNINLFELKEPDFPDGLDVYEPKVTFEKGFQDKISGTKKWEYVIIPRRDGNFLIPRSKLTYLNPDTGLWEDTETEIIELSVIPGKKKFTITSGLSKDEIELLNKDIRHIRSNTINFKSLDRKSLPSFIIMMNLLALLLFIGPKGLESVRSQINRDPAAAKSRRALKTALKKLKCVYKPDSYDEVAQAVYDFVADKMNSASANLDPQSVRELLSDRISEKNSNRLEEILTSCELGRFAPGASDKEKLNAIQMAHKTSSLLKEINPSL